MKPPVRVIVDASRLKQDEVRGIGKYLRAVIDAFPSGAASLTLAPAALPGPAHPTNLLRSMAVRRLGVGDGRTVFHATTPLECTIFASPQVVTIMDLIPISLTGYKRFGLRARAAYTLAAKQARIVTLSEFSKAGIIHRFGVPSGHINVAPLPPSPMLTDDLSRAMSGELASVAPYVVGFFDGRNESDRRKRYPWYLTVGRRLREMGRRLVLVGPTGDGPLSQAFRKERVVLTGLLPEPMLGRWLHFADFLVYPSAYEGQGMPIVEAFSVGTPVIAFRNTSIAEVVGDHGILLDEEISDPVVSATRQHGPRDTGAVHLADVAGALVRSPPPRIDTDLALGGFTPEKFRTVLAATYISALGAHG